MDEADVAQYLDARTVRTTVKKRFTHCGEPLERRCLARREQAAANTAHVRKYNESVLCLAAPVSFHEYGT
jgi:hypothetical protein